MQSEGGFCDYCGITLRRSPGNQEMHIYQVPNRAVSFSLLLSLVEPQFFCLSLSPASEPLPVPWVAPAVDYKGAGHIARGSAPLVSGGWCMMAMASTLSPCLFLFSFSEGSSASWSLKPGADPLPPLHCSRCYWISSKRKIKTQNILVTDFWMWHVA